MADKRAWCRAVTVFLCAVPVAVALATVAVTPAASAASVASSGSGRQTGSHDGGRPESPSPDPGRTYESRVVGGSPVPDGTYRFMASMQLDLGEVTPKESHFCGGSLISPYHVLTAAHCVAAVESAAQGEGPLAHELSQDQLQQLQAKDAFGAVRIALGAATLNGGEGTIRRIASASVHPGYEQDLNKDVAVITLKSPVADIAPIQLATTGSDVLERPGTPAVTTGWGNTIPQPYGPGEGLGLFAGPNRMHQVSIPIVADVECEAVYPPAYVSGRASVCAGETDMDACQGDSGGPLFKRVPGGYRQIGVTSRGYGCGATGFPGIWAQVSAPSVGDFIRTAVGAPPVSG